MLRFSFAFIFITKVLLHFPTLLKKRAVSLCRNYQKLHVNLLYIVFELLELLELVPIVPCKLIDF